MVKVAFRHKNNVVTLYASHFRDIIAILRRWCPHGKLIEVMRRQST